MLRNLTSTTRNNAMTVSAVFILALAFSYYFLGYVPSQQENLHKQNFRALKTISGNTNDIIKNISTLAGNQIAKAWSYFSLTTLEDNSAKIDSAFQNLILNKTNEKKYNGSYLDQLLDTLPNAEIAYIYPANSQSSGNSTKGKDYSLVYNSRDTIKLSFNGGKRESSPAQKEYHESSILLDYNCKTNSKSFNYGIWVNMQKIISPLVNKETFEDFFLIKDNEIICGLKTGIVVDNLDTILKHSGGVEASAVADLSISGQNFKIFSLPFRLTNGDKVVLCGMVRAEKYRQDTMNIPGDIVLLVLLLIFLIALAFPIAKLLLMSRQERLNISDVVFTGISIVVGTSVFILICINLYNFKSSGKITQDGHLENFSLNVEDRFLTELKSACKQLQFYDQKIDSTSYFDMVNLRKKPMFNYDDTLLKNYFKDDTATYMMVKRRFTPINKKLAENNFLKPSLYSYFSAVSWADESGIQAIKWSSTPDPVERVDVSDRDFFKRIQKGNTLAPLEPGMPEFSLESVFAKSTGENLAVVAIKSHRDSLVNKISDWYIDYSADYPSLFQRSEKQTVKFIQKRFKPSVIMLSTKLYSVMNPVLPPNYGFCIMDHEGKVLFHSGGAKYLNENFLDNCDNSSDLKAAIYSRTSSTITSRYQNKSYRMNIKPIGKLPLFLVIFHDDEDNRTINTEVLSMTMILTLGYFCFISILLAILRLSQWKRSKLNSTKFVFEWLWPMKNKNLAYKQVFEFIIFLIALLIIFLFFSDSFCSILLLFISIAFILLFLYQKIDQTFIDGEKENKKKIFLNLFRGRNSLFLGGVIFALLLLDLIAWNDGSGFFLVILYECVGFALITFLLLRDRPLIRIRKIREFDFLKSYLFMQTGLLFITSIVPIIVFFKIAFDEEIILHIRHGQIDYAQKMSELSDKDKTGFVKKEPLGIYSSNELNVYDTTFYNTRVHWGPSGNSKIFEDNLKDTTFEKFLSLIRPVYNTIAAEEKNLAPSVSSGLFNWGQDRNGLLFLQNNRSAGTSRNNARDITIVSFAPEYNSLYFSAFSPGRLSTLFVWLAFMLFIVVLFFFMRFIFSKMFATGFFDGNEFVPTAVEQNISYIRSKNIFLIGAPSSGKRTWLEEIYGADIRKSTIDLVNLRSDSDIGGVTKLMEGNKTIVLDHFEYGLNDHELNNRKLSLLISLFGKETHNIIILSAIHPAFLIEEITNAEKIQSEREIPEDNRKKTKDDSVFISPTSDKWLSLLGSFYKVYFPLQTMVNVSPDENIPRFIFDECRHSPFLIPVQNAMVEFVNSLDAKNHPVSEEEIILQIQSMAHPYYDSLWNSLSKEEQYTVFDIAQDGLANTKNREVILMLLNKGILVYEDKLKIMNRSFQNFVLSEMNSKTILAVEKNNIPTGNWARVKSPLVIILIAVAIFIFATQQETFNRVIAFITTFAAGLPVILRLVSLLSFNSGGKQA